MRAAVFREAGRPLCIETVPDPVPGPGELVVQVGRSGICGTDLHLTDVRDPKVPPGTVLGHEFAGIVAGLGAGVERFQCGDRVFVLPLRGCGQCASCLAGEPAWCAAVQPCYGGFADYAVVAESSCFVLPGALSLADGALLEPLAVALHAVAAAGMRPGARVLVQGAGPIGLGVVFWARRLGAGHITVVEGAPARAALALRMGASVCIAPGDCERDPAAFAMGGAADPEAPELVFECVGKPGLVAQAIAHVRPRGTVVSAGFCMSADTFVPAAANVREARLLFPLGYSARDFAVCAEVLAAGAPEARLMVTATVPLGQLPQVFEQLRSDRTQCKVMVAPLEG